MDSAVSSRSGSKKMQVEVKIRAYDEAMDLRRVDELEKRCEAGPGGGASLFTDLLGDPLCRVRQYPAFAMLVAETQSEEIVGLVRAGVKEVACVPPSAASATWIRCSSEGSKQSIISDDVDSTPPPLAAPPLFVSIAYILGLRVAPKCRRLGIGAELVKKMEEWCKDRGAEYVYIATEKDNEASVGLFTKKLGYVKFRSPAILVQPVYVRRKKLSKRVQVVELSKEEACKLYRNPSLFGKSEFFPKDIEDVVKSKLHRGTWVAFWKDDDDDERGGAWVRRFRSIHCFDFAHLGCFGSKSRICGPDHKDGRNDWRMRRFHGVLDSSGVCDLDCKEDGGCGMRDHMLHGVRQTASTACANRKKDGGGAHCANYEGANVSFCRHDDGVHKQGMEEELDFGFDPTPTWYAHAITNKESGFVCPSVNPHHASSSSSSSSWAMLSLWKCNEIYQLEMKGVPLHLRGAAAASRAIGHVLPIPTMPNVFKPFGLQLMYGMHAEGPRGNKLARHLCWFAHNLAKEDGCAVVAAEVASCDPLLGIIPRWTCDEDLWCIKRLATSDSSASDVDDAYDWSKFPPPPSLFLDPRDF